MKAFAEKKALLVNLGKLKIRIHSDFGFHLSIILKLSDLY